jgi:hypothetical protein
MGVLTAPSHRPFHSWPDIYMQMSLLPLFPYIYMCVYFMLAIIKASKTTMNDPSLWLRHYWIYLSYVARGKFKCAVNPIARAFHDP